MPKNQLKIGFGKVLSSIWEGFGRVWGVSWAFLGAFWWFFGRSKSSFFEALVQDRHQEAIWIDLGSILDHFGKVWGGIWEDLKPFEQAVGRFWQSSLRWVSPTLSNFSMSGPPRCLAKPRGASQCAGVLSHRVLDRILGNGNAS